MNSRLLILAAFLAAVVAGAAVAATTTPVLPSADPFYSYSGSLAGIAPGTVLKQRAVSLVGPVGGTQTAARQVLYRTSDELGRPSITVATIIQPAAPVGPTHLVSYQPAYDTLGPQCDPSYAFRGGDPADNSTNSSEEKIVDAYVNAGDTVVVSDYEGVNLDWGAGQESGYGTLDGIRAAEHLLKLPASGTPVGIVGYSGGSIATDYAAELASAYAPELDIVGAAEGGVPVDFAHNLEYVTGSQGWSGIIPAVLVALTHAFRIDLPPYLSPLGHKLIASVTGKCINGFYGASPGLRYQQLLRPRYANIYGIRPFAQVIDRLIMSRTGTPRAPVFIGVGNADGKGDGIMITADDEALAHAYCQRGVPVQFKVYSGDDHGNAAIKFEPDALSFLTDRLNGLSTANECSQIGAGNSIAPLPIPPAPKAHHKRRPRHHRR